MATWKEKGVVPDSDDDDSSDSHSVASYGGRGDEARRNQFHGQHDDFENENDEEEENIPAHSGVHYENPQLGLGTADERITNLPTASTKHSTHFVEDNLTFRSSPPSPQQVFKVPHIFFDIDDAAADDRSEHEAGSNARSPRLANGVSGDEEISKSYVQLSSPLSSLSSTLPGSQQSLVPSKQKSHFLQDISSPSQLGRVYSPHPTESIAGDISMQTLRDPPKFNGRSLRQRNPIQLHPYIVEQEKYRRILKARGMTPMRLAHTQDKMRRRSRDESSPDPDSQSRGSQDVIETEESQAMDLEWNPGPPSSGQKLTEDGADSEVPNEDFSINEDEDFPDIQELLQRRATLPRLGELKRTLKSYSTKTRRRITSNTHPQSTGTQRRRDREANVFDIPASPPATSSPFTTVARDIGNSLSRAVSVSSKEPTPSWLGQDELSLRGDMSLPTPVTSTVKPIPDAILVESDSDGTDPFADNLDAYSSSSSSDGSIQIRRIGKKIRGVLPASHLRLDQPSETPKAPHRLSRESSSVSPGRLISRRGVALPKSFGNAQNSALAGIPLFLSDDSDDGEDTAVQNAVIREVADSELESPSGQPPLGSAEEDDRIDAMLPARKRQSRRLDARPRKKKRVGSTSLSRVESETHPRQVKITDHLKRYPKVALDSRKTSRKAGHRGDSSRRSYKKTVGRRSKPVPPRLSILDVADEIGSVDGRLPHFIRIAARTSRSRKGQGRHSPSRKFVRLATREDTVDAQSVLQDWRDSKIQPKNLNQPLRASRQPLHEITSNRQPRIRSPTAKIRPRSHGLQLGHGGVPRKLVVSKLSQRSMDSFVATGDAATEQSKTQQNQIWKASLAQRRQERPRFLGPLARPGQLEASEADYSLEHPATAFRTTKKALDALYRTSRKRPVPQANLQLSRFLADDDVFVQPSMAAPTSVHDEDLAGVPNNATILHIKKGFRSRKRQPQRIDASAALYRQPNEPLILDFLQPASVEIVADQGSKLLSLGELGTNYPCHFDIFPLQSGIFFHESTFIGSGRLSEALKHPGTTAADVARPHISFWLADKEFRWGPWGENVSSEVGVCFDWLLDQLIVQRLPIMNPPVPGVVGAVTFVVDYVQHHVSFSSSQNRQDFLSRMSEVLHEFSSRLDMNSIAIDQKQVQNGIEVLARCAVLVIQMLQVSRQEAEQSPTMYSLENLLRLVAQRCVGLLLSQRLDGIRKLYDDLQYLSFRESGIKSDQYAVEAWVIIAKVLGAAQIPRGSFWDVTNSELMSVDVKTIDDARTMEKMWYSMFSLLPLCEFDDFGVIIPGQRQKASFDNWSLPQQMLKRVFALYTSRPRQSPGFNDYCRTIVSRCHYLMLEWGWWKCRGVIGTLFDFFASQNLAHLRNEEVYTSPRFLEELDTQPSLAVEAEDRCFHIFLKILALAIKHMRQAGDAKDIRNLVTRVLPNHGRQYPKEEVIRERELASLRNHHDLLCTLYWSAPADQRRSPDLIDLLQRLIVPARSHNEACLINLNAWTNLARFTLTSFSTTCSSTILQIYRPIKDWQTNFFSELLQEYLREEMEARNLAESRPADESAFEASLQDKLLKNRRSTLDILCQSLIKMSSTLRSTQDVSSLLQAFNGEIMSDIFNSDNWGKYGMGDEMSGASIEVLKQYMERLEAIKPRATNATLSELAESDSQDSQQFYSDIDRQTMIHPLYEKVLPNFAALLTKLLEGQLEIRVWATLREMVLVWGQLVSLVTEDLHELKEFVTTGPYAVFEYRQKHQPAMQFWPFFLLILVEKKTFTDLLVPGFNIGLEWMLAITKPKTATGFVTATGFEHALTSQLRRKCHYLLVSRDDMSDCADCPSKLSSRIADGEPFLISWKKPHLLIRAAIENMREIRKDSSHNGFAFGNNFSQREIEILFSSMLLQVMETMRGCLESMTYRTNEHDDYVTFCQEIASEIRSQGSDIRPLIEFFTRPSVHYWPEKSDPSLYEAGLVSYIIRLKEEPSNGTSNALFHFLYNGWKKQAANGIVRKHRHFIREGMRHWDFVQFMLTEFVPATLCVGFNAPGGWILNVTYLSVLASRIAKILDGNDATEAMATFEHTLNLLKIIMNGLISLELRPDLQVEDLYCDRGMMSIGCQFWLAVAKPLRNYAGHQTPEQSSKLSEILDAFEHFRSQLLLHMNGSGDGDWGTGPFDVVEGQYTEGFAAIIERDIDLRWEVWEDRIKFIIGGPEGNSVLHRPDLCQLVRPLGEVLEAGAPSCFKRIMNVLF